MDDDDDEQELSFGESHPPSTLLQHGDSLLETLVLGLKLPLSHLDLIRILHGMVDEIQSIVWPITLLFDHGDVLAESLLSILQLSF